MLVVSVELLHGTFRADPDGTANTGGLTRGEWPPAPARLFGALVAADGTRNRCRVTDGSELQWFERLPPPTIHADPTPYHRPLLPRYVVKSAKSYAIRPANRELLSHLEYVGRQGVRVYPGVRVTPADPQIVYRWDVDCPPDVLHALRRRAARIGYFGASDSPVRLRVGATLPEYLNEEYRFVPDRDGDTPVCVPEHGDLAILDRLYDAWLDGGPNVSRTHFPTLRHQVLYRSPRAGTGEDRGRVVAWLRLGDAVSGRRVSVVTSLFKGAVLFQYQATYGDEPPPVLHGHGFTGQGYDLARFLALPDAGFARSRGRIHGLALWIPPGTDPAIRARAREAALCIRRLRGGGVDVLVTPHAGELRPVAAQPARWSRPSRSWVSAFPVVHERRGRLTLTEISRWCRHAGLPAPVAFRSTRAPLMRGCVDLAPVEVNRPDRPRLPYSHMQLWFRDPVPGPVVLGAARQRGLGLCVPAPEASQAGA